jgi:hypothetical protein
MVVPPGRGLFQMFYCTNAERECDSQLDGWSPFSACHAARIVDGPTAPSPERPRRVFPRKSIIGWERFDDLPHPEDHEQLGITYDYDFPGKKVRLLCAEFGVDIEVDIDSNLAEAIGVCASGDKLGGWPAWIQGAEYPACPRCATQMTFVVQIDSEDHVPFMFGDAGCGHITQCPRHPDVLAFLPALARRGLAPWDGSNATTRRCRGLPGSPSAGRRRQEAELSSRRAKLLEHFTRWHDVAAISAGDARFQLDDLRFVELERFLMGGREDDDLGSLGKIGVDLDPASSHSTAYRCHLSQPTM